MVGWRSPRPSANSTTSWYPGFHGGIKPNPNPAQGPPLSEPRTKGKPRSRVKLVSEARRERGSEAVFAVARPSRTPQSPGKRPRFGSWLRSSGQPPRSAPICRLSRGVWVWNGGSQCNNDSGKGGCRRFRGFRRAWVAGPSRGWRLLLPNE